MKKSTAFIATLTSTIMASVAFASSDKATQASDRLQEIQQVIYACKDNQNFSTVFVNTAKSSYAIITQQDELISLEIMPMASGANYQAMSPNYTYKLYTKGDNATLEADGKPMFEECQVATVVELGK